MKTAMIDDLHGFPSMNGSSKEPRSGTVGSHTSLIFLQIRYLQSNPSRAYFHLRKLYAVNMYSRIGSNSNAHLEVDIAFAFVVVVVHDNHPRRREFAIPAVVCVRYAYHIVTKIIRRGGDESTMAFT